MGARFAWRGNQDAPNATSILSATQKTRLSEGSPFRGMDLPGLWTPVPLLGIVPPMQLLSGKAVAAHITGILHPKYQVHGFSVHLTARTVSSLDSTGQIDFGGGEYVAAGRMEIAPQQLRLEDKYLWWDLSQGSYFIQCNEALHLGPNEIALIEPEGRLLRAGASHVPLFVRGHIEPVELLLHVGAVRLRVKENARIARVRIFRIEGTKTAPAGSRKNSSKKPKRAGRKK